MAQLRAGALVIGVDAFFNSHSDQLAALATRHAVPTISAYQEFTTAGGLMKFSAGSRSFLRYGYGDLMREDPDRREASG